MRCVKHPHIRKECIYTVPTYSHYAIKNHGKGLSPLYMSSLKTGVQFIISMSIIL